MTGKILAAGSPADLKTRTHATYRRGCIHRALLPEQRRAGRKRLEDTAAPHPRRRAGHHRARSHLPFRRLYRRRSRELHHRTRRDFRLRRLERMRQDHDHEDADRLAAAERGRGAAVRQAARRQRHRFAPARRLHVAIVLALHRTHGAAEPRSACAAFSSAGAEGEGAARRAGRAIRS